ncbi:MAG: DUF5654 family protein [Nanoarchaeota archaeon]
MTKLFEEIKKQTLTLVIAAFGFVAALVWKDAITEWLKPLYGSAEGPLGLTIAAFVVTIVVVIVTIMLAKLLGPKNGNSK